MSLYSSIDRRINALQADIGHQERRMERAQVSLKAELASIKTERGKLKDRERAARLAYTNVVGTAARLADCDRAALKDLEG